MDGTADKHLGKVLGYGADNGANGEAGEGEEKEGPTTPEMGESDPVRLPDGGGKKERGSGPEGFDGVAMEGDGDYLWEESTEVQLVCM